MQKITLRISALDQATEESTVQGILGLLGRYQPAQGVIIYVEGDPDLAEIFMGPTFSGYVPDKQTMIKEFKQAMTEEDI
jgi:hypothetical protein